jgi:transposase-like protein
VLDHQSDHGSQWAAIGSIAAKIGCTAETLRRWVRQAERHPRDLDSMKMASGLRASIEQAERLIKRFRTDGRDKRLRGAHGCVLEVEVSKLQLVDG